MTPYPDAQLFEAVSGLQRDKGIRRTGEVRPGDDTEKAIRLALNETSPHASETAEKTGKYIWRTRGDRKVRSEHAARDGKVFDWDNPPVGGHPGEASNCRCTAEAINCNREEIALTQAEREFFPVDGELSRLGPIVHNARLLVERHHADEEFYHHVNRVAQFGGLLTMAPHPLGRFAGWVFQVGEKMSSSVLHDIEADIKRSETELKHLEELYRSVHANWKNRKVVYEDAKAALARCESGQ